MPATNKEVLAVSLDPRLLSALMKRLGMTELTVTDEELKQAPPLIQTAAGVVRVNK